MKNAKPWVQVAAVCEKVLTEKDNVLSAIRLVDTLFTTSDPPTNLPDNVKAGAAISILVSLKSGDVTGQHEVQVRVLKPTGEAKDLGKWPVILNGGEHGANLIINLMFETTDYGLWWFEVVWEGEILTRIPLKLARQPVTSTSSPQKLEGG